MVGVLKQPIIDTKNGKVAGFLVGHGFLTISRGAVASDDIIGYDDARVMVQSEQSVRQVDDEPKIAKIIKQKILVHGAKVITADGKFLGRADDLLIDTDSDMVIRYYVHSLVQDRIIAAESIIRIEKRGIIVDDNISLAGVGGVEAELTSGS